GIDTVFVQDNLSLSLRAGTIRGLHLQLPPHAQAKLVSVVSGCVLDVAVDLRMGSPTFAQHVAVELSAASGEQLYVPEGFAHGFCTLEAETRVAYKVSAFYAPDHEAGLRWDDPALGIAWPVAAGEAMLSEKDLTPPLATFDSPFLYKLKPV
ncbi:MAG: dTDP-4-dehydrorhamnose 3,5-epimerase, partial [Alphaproteobacteria bacterium]|nr:dTDP-4-dehydrorhamnose 3,5-epimerase [Alphaproteobacteria bacterium]